MRLPAALLAPAMIVALALAGCSTQTAAPAPADSAPADAAPAETEATDASAEAAEDAPAGALSGEQPVQVTLNGEALAQFETITFVGNESLGTWSTSTDPTETERIDIVVTEGVPNMASLALGSEILAATWEASAVQTTDSQITISTETITSPAQPLEIVIGG